MKRTPIAEVPGTIGLRIWDPIDGVGNVIVEAELKVPDGKLEVKLESPTLLRITGWTGNRTVQGAGRERVERIPGNWASLSVTLPVSVTRRNSTATYRGKKLTVNLTKAHVAEVDDFPEFITIF
jgi:HSP20 family molecular chaperone IbpA